MTVNYTSKLATINHFAFVRILFLWRGSVYRLIWFELIIYTCLYTMLSLTYRFLLSDDMRETFELVCIRCRKFSTLIPMTFALGFYVSLVVDRWWSRLLTIPWPDGIAMNLTAFSRGRSDECRLLRRTVMRLVNLSFCVLMRKLSSRARLLLPTTKHLVTSGLMTEEELPIYIECKQKCSPQYMLPLIWALEVVKLASHGKCKTLSDTGARSLTKQIIKFHEDLDLLNSYSWINLPLAYTQMATLAVYAYLLNSLLGMQYLDPDKKYDGYEIDLYVPVLALVRFVFFMGWLKVAEELINPLGNDQDDFEIDESIVRNLEASYLIVDELPRKCPPLSEPSSWTTGKFDFGEGFVRNANFFVGALKKYDVIQDNRNGSWYCRFGRWLSRRLTGFMACCGFTTGIHSSTNSYKSVRTASDIELDSEEQTSSELSRLSQWTR